MFKKIDFTFENLDIARLKGEQAEKYGLPTCYLTHFMIKDFDYFRSLHAGKIKFNIMPRFAYYTEIQGTSGLPPHTDTGAMCALNCYIQAGDTTTTFYAKNDKTKMYAVDGEIDWKDLHVPITGTLDFKNLDVIGEFKANDNESYLIRVDLLHSVTAPVGVRSMISYRWYDKSYGFDYSFQDIIDSIELPNQKT